MSDPNDSIDFDEWLQNYYLNPRPEIVPSYLRFLRSTGALTDPQWYWSYLGIFSALFARYTDDLTNWFDDWSDYDEKEQRMMLEAIWLSSTPNAHRFLANVGSTRLRELFGDDLMEMPHPDFINQPVIDPGVLDFFWSNFFVSGKDNYVLKVIDCLPFLRDHEVDPDGMVEVGPMVAAAAAKWSISANAYRHARVLEICRAELVRSSGTTREVLGEIIETVESGAWESASREQARRKKSWWQFWK